MSAVTILIPARDEAAVIGRTLRILGRRLPPGPVRVVVIANACSDATAAEARAALPEAEVIETPIAGKCHALNLGYRAAIPGAPVVVLDADLEVGKGALDALLAPLRAGRAQAACGRMAVATDGASLPVRLFYEGWHRHPYFARGKFGGLFALSPQGAARVFPLPQVTADDEVVRRSFAPSEVAFVPDCRFVARAPATLGSLIRVRRRSLRGARAITQMGLPSPERGSLGALLRRAATRPGEAIPIAAFLLVTLWVRLSLALERTPAPGRWERDLTSRRAR
jgi:glycosyltransferase involved in cell wall biosynthesis